MSIKSTFRNVSLTFVFLTLATILSYIVRIILARNLSTEDYGLFYAIAGFFSFFAIFRSLGITESLTHLIPKYIKEKNMKRLKYAISFAFRFQIAMSLIFASLFMLFANQIAVHFFHVASISQLIKLYSLTFLIMGTAELLAGIFNGLQKPQIASLYDPLRLGFVVLTSLVLLYLGKFDIFSLVITWMLSYLFMAVVYSYIFTKYYSNILGVKTERFKDVISDIKKYSIPLMFGIGADLILSKSDVLILTVMKGVQEVGLYEIAFPVSRIQLLAIAPFTFILFPMISRMFFNKESKNIREIMRFAYNSGLFMMLPISIIIVLYPDLIIRTLFSGKYLSAVLGTQVFAVGVFFLLFAQINFSILSGMGEIKRKTKILYFAAIFNILGDILLIPKYGYLGAIFITSVSYFIMWILSYFVCKSELKGLNISYSHLARILLSGTIFASIIIYLKGILVMDVYPKAILITLSASLVYLLLGIFVFKIVNRQTAERIWVQIRR